MSTFKNKLLQEVINPATNSRRSSFVIGEVTEANNTNKCKVDFTDNNGFARKNEIVDIQVYGNTVWFPKKGDKVVINQVQNNFIIVSKYIGDWSEYKKKTSLKSDVYSNTTIDSTPGFIL